MTQCERCGDNCKRRKLCYHCGHLVCVCCWRRECRCEPGHKPENCFHFNLMKGRGRAWYVAKVVARSRALAGLSRYPYS